MAFGYDWANKQGGYIVCRSDTCGTKSNNSDYDGAIELYCMTNSKQNCCSILSNGTVLNNGIAISVNSVGSNYVRFDNGIQIVFDTAKTKDTTDTLAYYYTFPLPFKDTSYICVSSPDDADGASYDSVYASSEAMVKIKGNKAKWHRLHAIGFWK